MDLFSRLAELSEDWKSTLAQNGKQAVPAVLSEIIKLPYRHLRFSIFAFPLTRPLPDLKPKIPLEIRQFSQADVELVRKIDRPSEARACARRLACGQLGLIAFSQGRPAGYAWGCTEIVEDLERVHIQLLSGDVLCTDAFTAPSFRGKGIQTALALARFQLFQGLGSARAICYIEENNQSSLAVWQKKLNCEMIGRIDFQRIGPWYRVRITDRPPAIRVEEEPT
jgi:GNAT superfamily N-acetyltransferase